MHIATIASASAVQNLDWSTSMYPQAPIVFAGLVFASSAFSQTTTESATGSSGVNSNTSNELTYEATTGPDGTLRIVPTAPSAASPDSANMGGSVGASTTVANPFVLPSTIENQSAQRLPEEGIIVLQGPLGEQTILNSMTDSSQINDFVTNAPMGSVFYKVNPNLPVGTLAGASAREPVGMLEQARRISRGEIEEVINDILESAQQRVCNMTTRPDRFDAGADIKVGFGVEGSIKFTMSWTTERLCQDLAKGASGETE